MNPEAIDICMHEVGEINKKISSWSLILSFVLMNEAVIKCVHVVVLSTRLFVGLHNSTIPGAFMIHGIVMMGDSSITLCSDSLVCWSMLFFTLCSPSGCEGASIAVI